MFSTSFVNALKFFIPNDAAIDLVLVGCGGTGSWFAPAIARVARWMMDQGRPVKVMFFDPDTVEEKNVFRQNFCHAEIGANKAETLANRYGVAWGIEISAITDPFNRQSYSHTNLPKQLFCGCVDRPSSRKAIRDICHQKHRAYWLDCGNSYSSGQVLIGGPDDDAKDMNPFLLSGFCTWLPSPAMQHPELVTPLNSPISESEMEGGDLSCAEMALRDSQGMAINQRMAAEAADYLVRLLITKDLRKYATYIDLESGTCRSEYITTEGVKKWMK